MNSINDDNKRTLMNSVSNKRTTLSVENNKYNPGDELIISLTGSLMEYTEIEMNFSGVATANVMAADRYQAAVQTNLGGGGSAMLVQNIQSTELFSIDCIRSTSTPSKSDPATSNPTIETYSYSVKIPSTIAGSSVAGSHPHTTLIPSYPHNRDDPAGVSIKYEISFVGKRKGIFKTNDSLKLEVPIVIPSIYPPTSLSPYHTVERALKYTTNDENETPTLKAELSYEPLTSPNGLVSYTLRLFCSNPSIAIDPIVTSSLSRKVRTTPDQDTKIYKSFDWAGTRISKGETTELVEQSEKTQHNRGEMVFNGKVLIPAGQVSIESETIGVRFQLSCQVASKSLSSPLIITLPVYIPSAPYQPTSQARNDEFDLPVYTAK